MEPSGVHDGWGVDSAEQLRWQVFEEGANTAVNEARMIDIYSVL